MTSVQNEPGPKYELGPRNPLASADILSIKKRIAARSEVNQSGCWIWTGPSDDGRYGRMSVGGRSGGLVMAHRASLAARTGYFPVGLEADHLCRTTLCVNPDHLEWVDHAENIRRIHDEMCPNGHRRTLENTRITKQGWRNCRDCNREKCARRRASRKVVEVSDR